jgi:Heterokaryon incompatibility protein (HET)
LDILSQLTTFASLSNISPDILAMPLSIRKLFKSKKISQPVPDTQHSAVFIEEQPQVVMPDKQTQKLKALSALENYKYEPLKAERDIRLIVLAPGSDDDDEVSCNLVHASLDRPPDYEAVSYVWGDPSIKKEIRCGKGKASVTLNLCSALRHLRQPHGYRTLWADAICGCHGYSYSRYGY